MSRSLRTTDYTGLKQYQVDALKKEAKTRQNRDRKGKVSKTENQNIHHTTSHMDCVESWQETHDAYGIGAVA